MFARNSAAALLALGLLLPQAAGAHGALISAEPLDAVRITAVYDTGEPMAGAQVLIHAPDDPAAVRARGETDAEGRFDLILPPGPPGRWTVQVRQAGHGAMIHLERGTEGGAGIGPGAAPGAAPAAAPGAALVVTSGSAVPHWLQRGVMVALVLWGALGTALYFRRARGGADASS